jgi:hypothetical protein
MVPYDVRQASLLLQGDLVPEFVPKVGLKFNALEDAYEYYCD